MPGRQIAQVIKDRQADSDYRGDCFQGSGGSCRDCVISVVIPIVTNVVITTVVNVAEEAVVTELESRARLKVKDGQLCEGRDVSSMSLLPPAGMRRLALLILLLACVSPLG